jgi:hypothetical protein
MGWLSKAWKAVTGTIKAIVSNPVTAIAAIGLAIYAPALGMRMLGSMLVSNVLNAVTAKDPKTSSTDGGSTLQQGTNQVMPVDPSRKIPVIYGSAWVSGILTDAKISSDNQTMWYVIAVCEAPDSGEATVTFGDMYWDEQKITFSGSEYGRVIKVTNKAGQEDTKIDGNLWIYPYNGSSSPLTLNGLSSSVSAITRLQDTAIPAVARWSNTDAMTGTIFYVVKCVYSTDDNMTGLRGLKARISVNQTGVTGGYRPGAAMIDYLTNDRYGAGLDPERVYAQSFAELDSYSDVLINFSQFGGGTASQPRYRINGILDTTQPVMSNLLDLADCCDAYIQFNEARGQWAVIANKSVLQYPNIKTYNELFVLDDTNIIGGVNIVPLDLNSTPNEVEVGFNSDAAFGAMAYTYATTPDNLKSVNEPLNKLTLNYKFVNDSVRAQYLSNRKLEQCRADYIVQLTADYSAIQVDAGDVVALTYKPYGNNLNGWGDNKLFRVTQVTENRADNGDLTVNLSLMEYAEAVYDDRNITEFDPPSGGVVLDPRLLAKPGTPTFPDANVLPSGNPPTFVVQSEVPRSGVTVAMEFWYGPTQEITNNNYLLFSTQYNSKGNQYAISAAGAEVYERETISGLPEGTWYWRVRAIGTSRKSAFSDAALINWAPSASDSGNSGGQSGDSTMTPVPLITGNSNFPDNTRGFVPAGGVGLVTAYNPGSIHVNFTTSINSVADTTMNCVEVWKSTSSEYFKYRGLGIRHSYQWNPKYYSGFNTEIVERLERISCVGTDGFDYISDDGGTTWVVGNAASVTNTFSSCITSVRTNSSNGEIYQITTAEFGAPAYDPSTTNRIYYYNMARRYIDGDANAAVPKYELWSGPISSTNRFSSLLEITATEKVPYTGGSLYPSVNNGTDSYLFLTSDGRIYFYKNPSANYSLFSYGDYLSSWANESTGGTNQPLYAVYANQFANGASDKNYTAVAVGGFGTVLKSSRNGGKDSGYLLSSSWSPKVVTTTNTAGETVSYTETFYGVAGDDSVKSSTSKWVACGSRGSIIYSNDDGETWSIATAYYTENSQTKQVTSKLNAVRYCNGKWIIVGHAGMILTSTNMTDWTKVAIADTSVETRNLYSVDYSPLHDTINISGDGMILHSPASTLNFTPTLKLTADESYTMERLWYRGSHANAKVTGTAVDSASQVINGSTVSGTIIDTDFAKNDEIVYYLVAGNIKGTGNSGVTAGGSAITAVEYKK